VVAAVDLEGCRGRVFTLLDASFDEVEIGMPVEVTYIASPFGPTVHRFRPVSKAQPA